MPTSRFKFWGGDETGAREGEEKMGRERR